MQILRLCDRGYSPLQIDYEGLQKKFPILKYGSEGQGGGGYEVGLNMDIYLQVSHLCDKSLQVAWERFQTNLQFSIRGGGAVLNLVIIEYTFYVRLKLSWIRKISIKVGLKQFNLTKK